MTETEIKPPSGREETAFVVRAVFHIVYWAVLLIELQASGYGRSAPAQPEDPPFVRKFAQLESADQRIFRSVQEGIGEAERARVRTGKWPTAEELAADHIPPFSPDPIDKAGYRWTSLIKGNLVNYVGTPSADSERKTFVVVLTEPEAGVVVDPNIPVDEVHHKAGDLLLHVSTYLGPGLGAATAPVPSVNFAEGWQQILVGSSSVLGR